MRDPTTNPERNKTARQCMDSLSLTLPAVVDGMDDEVNMRYCAWPERIYVIDRGGIIRYKSGIGPFGFYPKRARAALRKVLEAK